MPYQNSDFTLLPKQAYTASITTAPLFNHGYRGVRLFLNITAASGSSPTLDIKLQELAIPNDDSSPVWIDITGASFAQQTAAATLDLCVYPGIAATANRRVSDVLPRAWRVVTTIGGSSTPTFTYGLGGCYLL